MSPIRFWLIVHAFSNAWPELRDLAAPRFSGADRPSDGRGNTSMSLLFELADGTVFHLLIDFGAGAFAGILRAGLPLPHMILVTHGHPDHISPMELDTLARALRDGGLTIPLVTSARTWDHLPGFQKSKFRHIPIEADKPPVRIGAGDGHIDIEARDASSHFEGGLIYRLTSGKLRCGLCFDLKNWDAIDPGWLDDLDLAVTEANSQYPLSTSTGHVSVAEDLRFFRQLQRPPRLLLFGHMGMDDPIPLNDGNLVATLAALAPDLNVRWAYKGMMVSSDHLPARNPVGVLDPTTRLVVNVQEKHDVHRKGLLHGSTLLLVRAEYGQVVVYQRDARMDYGGLWDGFGGHLKPTDLSPRAGCSREATEEVILSTVAGFRVAIQPDWLQALTADFAVESHDESNRELSTVFGLTVPEGLLVKAVDETHDGEAVELRMRMVPFAELVSEYSADPGAFADGLARVLRLYQDDPQFRLMVDQWLVR